MKFADSKGFMCDQPGNLVAVKSHGQLWGKPGDEKGRMRTSGPLENTSEEKAD